MKTRNIALTLEKAKEWYNSDNEALKEAALQAFTENELKRLNFKYIKTFEDAVKCLYSPSDRVHIIHTSINITRISKASAASFELNIIRKALNKGYEIKFDKGEVWYPYNPILVEGTHYSTNENGIEVAKIKVDNKIYTLFGSFAAFTGVTFGLGSFYSALGVGSALADIAFLGCATKEIAEHFGRYFAKEIFEAKYGDFVDYEWV